MSIGLIIALAALAVILLTVLGFVGWLFYIAIIQDKFEEAQINDETFSQQNCNGIPYILDKGLPYRGTIYSHSNIIQSLNNDYKFSMDNKNCDKDGIKGEFQTVNIPYCYNKMGTAVEKYTGDVWYEKDFEITKKQGKPVVRLKFLGSFLTTDVWIDGIHIGKNEEGYLPFSFDISSLAEGRHKLVIRVNNATSTQTIPIKLFENHRPGWHHYSGLHKEVFIEYLPQISVFKLSCITQKIKNKWQVETSVLFERTQVIKQKELKAKLTLCDKEKNVIDNKELAIVFEKNKNVAGQKCVFEIDNPNCWDIDNPYLYIMQVETEYEKSFVDFGFRQITWGQGNIYINDQKTFLKGVCRHEDNLEKGLEKDDDVTLKEYELIKEANGNFARLAHYPHSFTSAEIADKIGIYLWEEVPFYQAGHAITHDLIGKEFGYVKINVSLKKFVINMKKTALAQDTILMKIAAQSLIKLVQRDINHPSIVSWSVGNEIWSINKGAGKVLGWLRDTVRRYDTSRAVNYAAMCMPVLAKPFEASFKHMDWACINEYYGWYYGSVKGAKSLAKGIYKRYPNKPLVITETGSDTLYGLRDSHYPPKNKHSEDYQQYYLEQTWKNLSCSKAFSGFAVWVFKDFPCPEYTDTNPVPYYNMKGLFDKDMNKKAGYDTLQKLYKQKKLDSER